MTVDSRVTRASVIERGRRLLARYGLPEWTVEIDTRPTRGREGVCRFAESVIAVSAFYIDELNDRVFKDTIEDSLDGLLLHEIAHALRPGENHWLAWKRMFARLLSDHWRDDERVSDELSACPYCWRMADTLLEYAKKNSGEEIRIEPRRPKQKRKRVYPTPQRHLFVIEDDDTVSRLWILEEGPKTYLCSSLDDPRGEGPKRRLHKSFRGQDNVARVNRGLHTDAVAAYRQLVHQLQESVDQLQSHESDVFCKRLRDFYRCRLAEATNSLTELLAGDGSGNTARCESIQVAPPLEKQKGEVVE